MTTALIQGRTDEEVKSHAKAIFEDLGLDMSTAINIFLKKCIREEGIPFSVKKTKLNADSLKAFNEVETMIKDNFKNVKQYDNTNALFSDLLKD